MNNVIEHKSTMVNNNNLYMYQQTSLLITLVELKHRHSFFRYILKTDALIPTHKNAAVIRL